MILLVILYYVSERKQILLEYLYFYIHCINQDVFNFQYAIFLAILLLLEMTAGILGFIFKDWVSKLEYEAVLYRLKVTYHGLW